MSTPKPRIRPKPPPYRHPSDSPTQDEPPRAERDPPRYPEHGPGMEQGCATPVLFHEDDYLR